MVGKKIPVTNDYIFKKIFAKKGNESILKDFLIAVLEIPIEKVEVQAEVSLEKQLEQNKLGRLDILAVLDDNTTVNIEIQVLNPNHFIERTLYYWSGNYYNNLLAGEDYRKVKKTIAINILDYEQFEEGPFHEIARLRRDYLNTILTDKLEIHFIQIPKFKKEEKDINTKLKQWMQFISQVNPKGVELAMKENKEIKKANDEYEYLTGEAAERRLAFLRDKAIRDEKSMLEGAREQAIKEGREKGIREGRKQGREEGREKGREEGERKKQIEIAKRLLNMGIRIEDIEKATELTKEEIEKFT